RLPFLFPHKTHLMSQLYTIVLSARRPVLSGLVFRIMAGDDLVIIVDVGTVVDVQCYGTVKCVFLTTFLAFQK
ncbi:MAG TPA: hypothetical protein VGQ81_16375, partial [Acidobacteriota bacterium]|nr:hypothetical protein [Acidobacteriota bacterium]